MPRRCMRSTWIRARMGMSNGSLQYVRVRMCSGQDVFGAGCGVGLVPDAYQYSYVLFVLVCVLVLLMAVIVAVE